MPSFIYDLFKAYERICFDKYQYSNRYAPFCERMKAYFIAFSTYESLTDKLDGLHWKFQTQYHIIGFYYSVFSGRGNELNKNKENVL